MRLKARGALQQHLLGLGKFHCRARRQSNPIQSITARPPQHKPESQAVQSDATLGWESDSAAAVDAPSFSSPSFSSLGSGLGSSLGEDQEAQAAGSGGSKKTLLVAVVLLGVAAAGYFGWTRMQSAHPTPAPQAIAPATTGTASIPAEPMSSLLISNSGRRYYDSDPDFGSAQRQPASLQTLCCRGSGGSREQEPSSRSRRQPVKMTRQ